MQTITLEEAQARLLEVVHCVMSEKVELLRKQLSEAIDNALNKQLQSKYIINKDENIQES